MFVSRGDGGPERSSGHVNRAANVEGTVVQAGVVHGDIHLHKPYGLPPPRQLPAAPVHFVDRDRELRRMRQAVHDSRERQERALITISGTPGSGKSALATRFLHEYSQSAEVGQLYADLRGFSAEETPADPADVLADFLRALGVDPAAIPPGLAARAAWFRSATAQ